MAKRKRKTDHLDGTNVKNRNSRKSKTQLRDLPMDILSSIISRLPINEAIRTSILSRHWNHVWCHHTNLNFVWSTMMPRDSNLYSSPAVKRRKQRVFIKRVDDVLLQHSGAGVEHISIHFDLDGSHTADVNRWITFVIGSKAKALSLRLLYHAPEYLLEREVDDSIEMYSFPFQLFDAGNGSHLKFLLLTSISVKVPADFEGFTKLKKLYLCDLRIADEDLQHLLSKCSLLEFLSVTYCKTIIGLRVSHPASHLEQLEVASCSSLREIELNNDLTILEYRGHPISFISNGNPCLTNIFIKLSQADTSIKHLFTELPGTLPPQNALTSGFGGLERDISSTRHPQFVSLRSLILEMDIFAPPRTKPDVLDVAYLLQAAPFIERLEFHFSGSPMTTIVHLEGTTKKNSVVVAFGGIAAPSLSVRASGRQLERAMQNVNLRHDFTSPGYSHYGPLDPAMELLAPRGPARVHGFWMQPPSNGCPGYFLPGYLAVC